MNNFIMNEKVDKISKIGVYGIICETVMFVVKANIFDNQLYM